MSHETGAQLCMFKMAGSRLQENSDLDDAEEDPNWVPGSEVPYTFPLKLPDAIRKMFEAREFLMRRSGKDFRFDVRAWHEYLLTAPDKGHGYMLWPYRPGPMDGVEMLLGTPHQKRCERIATLMLNCSEYRQRKTGE